jgi:hypothetical protein
MQTQGAPAGDHVEMVMNPGARKTAGENQAPGHPEVNQQQPVIQVHQQVLAAPAHCADRAPRQRARRTPQRPAQGLARGDGQDPPAGNAVCEAQAGDFDFREFRHG